MCTANVDFGATGRKYSAGRALPCPWLVSTEQTCETRQDCETQVLVHDPGDRTRPAAGRG